MNNPYQNQQYPQQSQKEQGLGWGSVLGVGALGLGAYGLGKYLRRKPGASYGVSQNTPRLAAQPVTKQLGAGAPPSSSLNVGPQTLSRPPSPAAASTTFIDTVGESVPYTQGKKAACHVLGVKLANDWDTQDTLTGLGLGAAAMYPAYKYLRRFKPSDSPALQKLQEKAKDLPFEVATHRPTGSALGRAVRRVLYGADDISDDVAAAAKNREVLRRDSTVLHHGSPFSQIPVQGKVDLNAANSGLTGAMADKATFGDVFKQVREHLDDGTAVIPETEKMQDVLKAFNGDVNALQNHLAKNLPEGWLIKPVDESLGDVASFVSNKTDLKDSRWQDIAKNPNRFILQQKIPIKNEYRVHTVQGVPFASTHRRLPEGKIRDAWNRMSSSLGIGEGGFAHMPVTGDRRQALEDFVSKVNKPLTSHYDNAPLHQAFDVAELPDGTFRLIESNPTPGTFNNPLISRKLQESVTGRMHQDKALLGAAGLGTGLGVGTAALSSTQNE